MRRIVVVVLLIGGLTSTTSAVSASTNRIDATLSVRLAAHSFQTARAKASCEADGATVQKDFQPIDTLQRQKAMPAPWVATESEKPWAMSAAMGMRTMRERYPTMSAPPPPASNGRANLERTCRQPFGADDVTLGGVGVSVSRAVAMIVLRGVRPTRRTGSRNRPPQRARAIALNPMELIDISNKPILGPSKGPLAPGAHEFPGQTTGGRRQSSGAKSHLLPGILVKQ